MAEEHESTEVLKEIRDLSKAHNEKMLAALADTRQWVLLRLMVPIWALLVLQSLLLLIAR